MIRSRPEVAFLGDESSGCDEDGDVDAEDGGVDDDGTYWIHQANTDTYRLTYQTYPCAVHLHLTLERTHGGEGLRYAGSSIERGRDVDISITVVASLKVRDIVTASLGLRTIQERPQMSDVGAYFAGHPNVKFVFAILVVGSNISTREAASTAGSHSFLSSGVAKTDFHVSRETGSSPVGTSSTTRQTGSSVLLALRCITTSARSGMVERAFPLTLLDEISLGVGIRFHSGAEEDVSRRLKLVCASLRAPYHDSRRLRKSQDEFMRYRRAYTPSAVRHEEDEQESQRNDVGALWNHEGQTRKRHSAFTEIRRKSGQKHRTERSLCRKRIKMELCTILTTGGRIV